MSKKTKNTIIVSAVIGFALLLVLGPFLWVVTQKEYRHASKLIQAIKEENISQVESLLKAGIDPNQTDVPPSKFWYLFETAAQRPLAVACQTGSLEMVKLLLDYGASAEEIEDTNSPMEATLLRYDQTDLEIISLLLEHGANVHHIVQDELPVFMAAQFTPAIYGTPEYASGYDAVVAENITSIVALLSEDLDINTQTAWGNTLLMYAAGSGNLRLVEYLLDTGCDPTIQNHEGKTAYDWAVASGKEEIAKLLTE